MFDQELEFFIAHQDALVAAHEGKTLVLRGDRVEGAYETAFEAFVEAQKRFPLGTFMIQPCEPGPRAYTVSIE